ncbi:MAG: gamma-glutamyltransferase [Ardenticatenaceae bacterium]|nr:gamma-glutamyltransferase [Anaerolineales bacterium]MCB8917342.1 gamma-glutamyltransferase [Ardenticatenaceae bacterium]
MDFERYTFPSRRSNVMARNGLVATSQPLAAQAGLAVLQGGGNAVDAAIATVATLCVVEPTSTGIGGDAFALIWMAGEGRLYGLNASGPAPAGLTADWVRSQGHETMPTLGAIPVTVPGSLRGWQLALERFGTRGLDSLLAQPIAYARHGFPVSERIAMGWARSTDKMRVHEASRRVWLPGGHAPRPGTLFRNPEFAATLQSLAEQGYDAFYQGDIGRQIAGCVQAAGGRLTLDDLAAYQAEWVAPLSVPYGDGYAFHEIPPNGQGLTALLALNLVRGFDLPAMAYEDPGRVHLLIEAIKLAFADAHAYIADPRQADIPLAGLLSDEYTRQRRALIRPGEALLPNPGTPPRHGDTVYLTVADGQGNMVSWIQSLYMGFGSGLTAGTTGVQLQNRGANFSLVPGHPNEVAPGKRPYNTIIPGFITRHGQAWASFGVMGGFMQPQGHLQVGVNLVDYGMSPQAALDAPRFNWLQGREVALESAFPAAVLADLPGRGHQLNHQPHHFGGGQVILRDPDSGVLLGGSEPRNDGCAVGW